MITGRHDLDTVPLQGIEKIENTEGLNFSLSANNIIKTIFYDDIYRTNIKAHEKEMPAKLRGAGAPGAFLRLTLS